MKINRSTPQNKDFFNEHGSSLASYALIGFIGQLLSGISLAYAVYALILAQIQKQDMAIGITLLAIVAFTVAVFIELANRILARRAIKPFVVKGLFEDDAKLARRHKILNNSYLVGLLAIAALSYFLSAVGSNYYAEDSTQSPALIDTDSLKAVYADQLAGVDQSYRRDSATIAGPYDLRLQAVRERYLADSLALRKERERYRLCANEGNAYCKTKLTEYLVQIDRSKAAMNDSIAAVSALKGNALMAVLSTRETKAQSIDQEKTSALFLAEQKNGELLKENQADSSFKGLVFIILTIAGQTVFYLMVYLSLQVEAGSEINYEIQPNEFWNLPPVLDELKVVIAWRLERGLRRSIRWLFGEPGEHETAIPYRSLFDNTHSKKAGSVTPTVPKNTLPESVTFIAQIKSDKNTDKKTLNLAHLKQRLKMYKKRLASVIQKKIKQEKAGETVSQKTLNAITNNQRWVDEYTQQIQQLEAAFAQPKSK